jgi:hypothetical protein
VAALVPVDPADLSDLQDDRTDNPAQDEDGAGEVVPDDVDERVVHFKELLPSQIVSCCPKMIKCGTLCLGRKVATETILRSSVTR